MPGPDDELVLVTAGGRAQPVTMVQVGQVTMPSWFEARLVEQDNGEPDVSLVFEVRAGVPGCREVHIIARDDGHEVRVSGLAGIRVRAVLEQAVKLLVLGEPTVADGRVHWPRAFPTDPEQHVAVESVRTARAARKVKMTDDLLRDVADIYRNYILDNPTANIAELYAKSHRTAGLYVKAARERIDPDTGKPFLGPALRGRAGEQS